MYFALFSFSLYLCVLVDLVLALLPIRFYRCKSNARTLEFYSSTHLELKLEYRTVLGKGLLGIIDRGRRELSQFCFCRLRHYLDWLRKWLHHSLSLSLSVLASGCNFLPSHSHSNWSDPLSLSLSLSLSPSQPFFFIHISCWWTYSFTFLFALLGFAFHLPIMTRAGGRERKKERKRKKEKANYLRSLSSFSGLLIGMQCGSRHKLEKKGCRGQRIDIGVGWCISLWLMAWWL